MPSFITVPAAMQNRPLLVPGKRLMLFGTYNSDISPTLGFVTNASLTTNVATVTLQLNAGNIPAVNQLITIQQCSDSTFNVVGATITGVSGFNTGDNSTGTVTFALTHANVGSEAVTGNFVAPTPVIPDVCQNVSSMQVTLPFNDPRIDQSRTLVFQAAFPSIPTTALLVAEVSDDDSTYYSLGTVASVTGGVVSGGLLEVSSQSAKFARMTLSNVTGGSSPTAWASISA